MKKLILLGALLIVSMSSNYTFAQSNYDCSDALNASFGAYSNDTPVKLNRLGTSPQFGEIRNHTAASAYSHLKNLHRRNTKKSRVEIDRLLQLLGYSGFNDPSFDESKIIPEILYAGTTGWMGAYSAGHKYKWSVLGKDFPTFKVLAKNSPCFLYIMKKCGNAFHIPSLAPDCPPCPDCPRPASFLTNRDANCPTCPPCPPPCKVTTINISGEGKIASGNMIQQSTELPLIAMYGGEKVCLGTYTIPMKSTYEYSATGSAKYSQTVDVCDNGAGVLPNMDIKLPVNLGFNVSESQMSLGESGAMVLNVSNAKRFKQLKKQYGTCSADMTSSSGIQELTASNTDNMATSAAASAAAIGGGEGECKKQTLMFNGSKSVSDVNTMDFSNNVTVIGVYKKMGKLVIGESADKYLCLGTYSVPGKASMAYNLKGNSSLSQVLEICDKTGTASPERNIEIPVDLNLDISDQKMMVGDAGKIYIPLSEKEYKSLGKKFSRCCSDGSTGCF